MVSAFCRGHTLLSYPAPQALDRYDFPAIFAVHGWIRGSGLIRGSDSGVRSCIVRQDKFKTQCTMKDLTPASQLNGRPVPGASIHCDVWGPLLVCLNKTHGTRPDTGPRAWRSVKCEVCPASKINNAPEFFQAVSEPQGWPLHWKKME